MDSTPISSLPAYSNAPTAELPIRDVPRETISHVVDPQTNPVHIPAAPPGYIAYQPTYTTSKVERFLDEFRLPIMVAVIYFLFELPNVRAILVNIIPSMYIETTSGLLTKSLVFGGCYYGVLQFADYLSKS